jgi:hypothetical protein
MALSGGLRFAWALSALAGFSWVLAATGAVIVIALLVTALRLIVTAQRLSKTSAPPTAEEKVFGRRVGRTFGIVFTAEGFLIWASCSLLQKYGHTALCPPAVAAIVGVHFLPLARLFRAPHYYSTGVIACVLAVVSLCFAGERPRDVFLGVGMAVLLWLSCIPNYWRATRIASSRDLSSGLG